ncbi:MAG: N-acetylmuramoyl-L-alanine amidase [Deltaproteobacteria bacterium]|nr:N-acetylmuramoyl-L-alanine amidase [Deltaproteobacteria bacterium]
MAKIVIDPGHGGRDPGASLKGVALTEAEVALAVARAVRDRLEAKGHEVILTREELGPDEYLAPAARPALARDQGAEVLVSLHLNADPDEDQPGMPEAKGEEVWYHPTSPEGQRLAKCLQPLVDQTFPDEPFRGLKASDKLAVLRGCQRSGIPSCLIEMGFIDNSATNRQLGDPEVQQRLGELISEGILKYLEG